MTGQKPDASNGPLIEQFGRGDDNCCTACGEHFSDPHTPGCPADPDGDGEESIWRSSEAVHLLISRTAMASGAAAYRPAEWGDRNAEADVVTAPTLHGVVTVNYDVAAEVLMDPALAPMAVYAYPLPRRRRWAEGIVDYAAEAMFDVDGANREPVEVDAGSVPEAIAAALASLTP